MDEKESKEEDKELKLGDYLVSLDKAFRELESRVTALESALWRIKNSI